MQVVEKNMEETVYPTFIVVLTEVSSLYFPRGEDTVLYSSFQS